jgi:hypothetical protein
MENNPLTSLYVMPLVFGATPKSKSPYEVNILWQLYTALSMGPERARFMCLWDGEEGDGRGATKQMYDEVMKRSIETVVINPADLHDESS